ncbi:hypothetical protein [Hyalangium versicolor]|uniref:hypothetical protein n=1 Tax=Hyalangium versicolor TaxID=2861190 RepID=UPI001CCE0717|nr:hypothetical protein [Hyalangium versicolor]
MSTIGGSRFPSGSSVNFNRSTSTEAKTSDASWKQTSQATPEALSNNPAMRSFRGESGFEGVGGPGAAQVDGPRGPGPREQLEQLGQAIQELISTLETALSQQAGETDASGSTADASTSTDEASAASGTEATEDAASAEESEDPLQKILDTLKQLLGMIDQLQQRHGATSSGSTESTALASST